MSVRRNRVNGEILRMREAFAGLGERVPKLSNPDAREAS
jgi:hypothetical protein